MTWHPTPLKGGMNMESLIQEKKNLLDRLLYLNVQSTGRDRIIERLEAIDEEMKRTSQEAI